MTSVLSGNSRNAGRDDAPAIALQAADAAPLAILCAEGGRIAYANEEACRLLDATAAESIVQQPLHRLFDPGTAAQLAAARGAQPGDARPVLWHVRVRRLDGTEFEAGLQVLDLDPRSGRIALYLDPAATGVESQLAQVVESVPSGVALVDAEGRIALVNRELERLFGYARIELLGRNIEMLLPERYRAGHPALRGQYALDPKERPMGAGRDLHGRRKDGTEVPIEIGLNPVRTEAGMMVLAAIADISVRKRLEESLRRAVDAAPCGMVMVDAGGRMRMVNQWMGKLFGYSPDEMLGQPLEMLLPERHRAHHIGLRAGFHEAPGPRAMGLGRDLTARQKDGTEFPVEVGLNPIEIDGETAVLATVVDITERKKMDLSLRKANADMEEFTYVASHDLRSPLHGIADLVEWTAEALAEGAPPEVARNLDRIGIRVKRMERLIDDLLVYARATQGQPASEFTAVDFAQMVDDIVELLSPPPGFDIIRQIHAGPIKVARTPIETVLRNLVGNAIKHHDRDHGRIVIDIREDDSYCLFSVSDDGPGIPEKAQQRVFRLFQTMAAGQRGVSGIGLAVAKRLVETHGGRIELQSRDGERGTTFRFWWPQFMRRDFHD